MVSLEITTHYQVTGAVGTPLYPNAPIAQQPARDASDRWIRVEHTYLCVEGRRAKDCELRCASQKLTGILLHSSMD